MWDIVQIIGALLCLAGFLAAQFELLDERSYTYLIPNVVGSGALAVTAVVTGNWGFVLLEGVWCLVSCWGLLVRAGVVPAMSKDQEGPALWTLLLEFIGAILILVPFALLQAGRTSSRTRSYLWLNLVGAVILTYVGWVERQWGFVLVQFAWAVVAAWGLSPWRRQPRPSAEPNNEA